MRRGMALVTPRTGGLPARFSQFVVGFCGDKNVLRELGSCAAWLWRLGSAPGLPSMPADLGGIRGLRLLKAGVGEALDDFVQARKDDRERLGCICRVAAVFLSGVGKFGSKRDGGG